MKRLLFLAILLIAVSASAQPRPPLSRAIADALYAKLAGGSTIAGTTTMTNLTVTGTCTGCGGSGTVTSVGNGTIGALFTATWATATTTPALSFDITNQGTVAQVLHGNAAGHPTFGAVVSADLSVTGTTCSNQFLTVLSSSLAGTCTTATLASAQFANQGTTTTVLHGNGAGNPSFGSVALGDIATQATNTVVGNATSGTAVPTALAVATCSTAGSALIWTTNTGFGCNTSITANSATSSTTATTATNATNTAITDDTTTNASMNVTWVTTASGNQAQKVSSSKLLFNPSTGTLSATALAGAMAATTLTASSTITPSSTNGIVGTTTNDNANAGSIGQMTTASLAAGSAVTLTTATSANITSVSLTAGDWDCTGTANYTFGAATSYTSVIRGFSTTTATLDLTIGNYLAYSTAANVPGSSVDPVFEMPVERFSLSGTTTVFMVTQVAFSVSTLKAYGSIRCRRMR